jgi:hypothetical protein
MDELDNEKTPAGASSYSLRLNTDNYSTIHDTLKAHALAIVSNAHSEMSDEQFNDYVNELTPKYAEAITHMLNEAKQKAFREGQKDAFEAGDPRLCKHFDEACNERERRIYEECNKTLRLALKAIDGKSKLLDSELKELDEAMEALAQQSNERETE